MKIDTNENVKCIVTYCEKNKNKNNIIFMNDFLKHILYEL